MASSKSVNPKPTKQPKTSTANTEGNLAISDTLVEDRTQKRGPQPVEPLKQSQTARSASQTAQARSISQNGASSVTEEQIRERAYQLYLERGSQHGNHEDDWYRAESELRGQKP